MFSRSLEVSRDRFKVKDNIPNFSIAGKEKTNVFEEDFTRFIFKTRAILIAISQKHNYVYDLRVNATFPKIKKKESSSSLNIPKIKIHLFYQNDF